MKLINSSFEIYDQKPGLEGIYEAIEHAGRTCYKSTRPKGQTAKDFVDRMIASKHTAMLEHGTVYFKVPVNVDVAGNFLDENPLWTKCKHITCSEGNWWAITTNLRVMVEHFAPEYIKELMEKYLCEPTKYHEKRITVRFTADIHFYKDITRHRVFSWAIESTRFCNYLKEKFGVSIAFMRPTWIKDSDISELEEDCKVLESIYFKWINKGYQAQHAAYFLPQGTKAEIVMTGFASDYIHFFDLRAIGTTGQPHPDVKALVEPLMEEFYKRDYLK